MEQILSNLISIKDLLYIVNEYTKKEICFLDELLDKTDLLKYDSTYFYTYENYCICTESIGNIDKGRIFIDSFCYFSKSYIWKISTKKHRLEFSN